MLRYPCLVLDHDDTVVQSEATVNYPYFCYVLDCRRPGCKITLDEYVEGCFSLGFADMCRRWYGFTDQDLEEEYRGWQNYIKDHIPAPFPGIDRILARQRALGGKICVVSHSCEQTIRRDYLAHFSVEPDRIYGWDYPEAQRKPHPYPLLDIMQRYQLSPDQLLVVDDMKPAWEMARKAGTAIGFAGWGRKDHPNITREMTKLCNFSFFSPEELENFLFD